MSSDAEISMPRGDSIDLEVPLRTEYAATVRLVVASLAADAGCSVDEIDDLKLAVSEVFTQMVDAEPGDSRARARLSLTVGDATLGVHLSGGEGGAPLELDALSAAILSSVVDAHRVDSGGVGLVKRLTESAA